MSHFTSSLPSFLRTLLASRSSAALLALGVGTLAPQLAHADEPAAAAAAVDESVAASAAAPDLARPLGMRSLSERSSVGVAIEGSDTGLDLFDDTLHLYTGMVRLDGEIAFGGHFKVFASMPFLTMGGDHDTETVNSHGNLTLGAQVQGGQGLLHVAFGGSFSKWGDNDAVFGLYNHGDLTSFVPDHTIVEGFGVIRGGDDDRFVQAQISYQSLMTDGSSSDFSRDSQFGQVKVGGGMRVAPSYVLIAEAGIVRPLDDQPAPAPDEKDEDRNLYTADVGVRGGLAGSGLSWTAKVSGSHAQGVDSIGAGFELRTDLPGLSGQ